MNRDPQCDVDAGPCPRCGEDTHANETPGYGYLLGRTCGMCGWHSPGQSRKVRGRRPTVIARLPLDTHADPF